jgi:hypothetical protein
MAWRRLWVCGVNMMLEFVFAHNILVEVLLHV